MKSESKRGAVWLYGAPNSGKTTLLKMLAEIFYVIQYKQTRSRFDLDYEKEQKQPEFITIDEGAMKTFFTKSSLDDTKLFMEGQGYLHEVKHKNSEERWRGVPIILTSNCLPDAVKHKKPGSEGFYDYMAFRTRIRFHKLHVSYKNTDPFPYTKDDLIQYLQD